MSYRENGKTTEKKWTDGHVQEDRLKGSGEHLINAEAYGYGRHRP